MVTSAAASIPGLDVPRLLSDRDSATTDEQTSAFDSQANADGVTETPTILVGKSGATPRQVTLASPDDVQSVTAAIRAALG
jgi:hypothetical protein